MGHGTVDTANVRYREMNEAFARAGYDNIIIASVEAKPDLDDALEAMAGKNIKSVLVHPFMVVAGEHANNDMAGGDTDSYVSRLRDAGYQVTAVVKGLGEYESFRRLYVEKLKELMA
jgi:sirohydrochlorin cobaltochelatase